MDDKRQLSAQIDHVLNARVHFLAACWTVDMRRITAEENTADAQTVHHTAVDPEPAALTHVMKAGGNVRALSAPSKTI